MRRESALERLSVRDEAMLADALRRLQAALEAEGQGTKEAPPTIAEVEDLVSHAVAELHRLNGAQPIGTIAPVLGVGVLQELLRRRREGADTPDVPPRVDTRR
jgi:hypothetical protein